MGIAFSCPGADYDDLDEDFEALIVRSISFKGDDVDAPYRSLSFNGRDSEPTILKSLGSRKMIIEGSVSCRRRETDPFHLKTMISIKSPSLAKEMRSESFKNCDIHHRLDRSNSLVEKIPSSPPLRMNSPKDEAAVKLQKVYKSFRTRRKLADCAVLAEECWWKLLDFAALKRSSVSFFDISKPESAMSRWARARTRAAKVGKGLSKDEKARKLALQHWLEAIDPRHRYGHNLQFYYDSWLRCESRQPFFYWLDVGEGKEFSHEKCARLKLQQQCIKYLGPKERQAYEVIVEDGKFYYKQSRQLLNTDGPKDAKWIFVLSTCKRLYVGKKEKGVFQHSSFLAGGATSAAGRLVVENGILKAVWPHSGHYHPTKENFQDFMSFLEAKEVNLTNVKHSPTDEDDFCLSKLASLKSTLSGRKLTGDLVDSATDTTNRKHLSELNQRRTSHRQISNITIPKRMDFFEHSESPRHKGGLSLSRFAAELQSSNAENVEESTKGGLGSRSFSEESLCGSDEMVEESSTSEEHYMSHKRNLFEEDHDDDEEVVPEESILCRINSKKRMESYQLGRQLSCKWTTGAGPRIGCVRDYPTELQFRALEQVNLSPRSGGHGRPFSPGNMSMPSPKGLGASLSRELGCTSLSKETSSSNNNHH